MDRLQKEKVVCDVRSKLSGKSLVVVVKQSGVTVDESTQLRRNMLKAEAEFKVLKNTLLQIAISGTEFSGLKQMISGPTALAFSKDPISAAKVVADFCNDVGKLEIVGGWMNGSILTKSDIMSLAKLPSLDELRAKILGVLVAPATKLVRTIKEPMSRVARVIGARN